MRTGAAVSEEGLLAHEALSGRYGRIGCPGSSRRSRDGLGGIVPVRLARSQPDSECRAQSDGDRRAGSLGNGHARPHGERRAQPTGVYANGESNPRTRPDSDRRAEPTADANAQPTGRHSSAQSVQVGPVC